MKFSTQVHGNYLDVMDQFDRSLFEALAPSFVPVKILNFTGSQTGDQVHLQFGGPINTDWISRITDHGISEEQAYFVDEGVKLPFPLKSWHHQHIVQKISDSQSLIMDVIDYKAQNIFLSAIIYPVLYMGFYQRASIYRKYFQKSPDKLAKRSS